jgi:hypothetical protein
MDTPGLPPVPRVYGLAASVFRYPASYADTGGSSLHQRGGAPHPSFLLTVLKEQFSDRIG